VVKGNSRDAANLGAPRQLPGYPVCSPASRPPATTLGVGPPCSLSAAKTDLRPGTQSLLSILIASPWLALLPALAFAAIGYRGHRTVAWVAAVVWLLYAAYETAMKWRILCSGECNIRVDLLLLYPFLLVLSLIAVIIAIRGRRGEV
jgi:hypothetical protein